MQWGVQQGCKGKGIARRVQQGLHGKGGAQRARWGAQKGCTGKRGCKETTAGSAPGMHRKGENGKRGAQRAHGSCTGKGVQGESAGVPPGRTGRLQGCGGEAGEPGALHLLRVCGIPRALGAAPAGRLQRSPCAGGAGGPGGLRGAAPARPRSSRPGEGIPTPLPSGNRPAEGLGFGLG